MFAFLLGVTKDESRPSLGKPSQNTGDVLVERLVKEVTVVANMSTGLNKGLKRDRTIGVVKRIGFSSFDKGSEFINVWEGSRYSDDLDGHTKQVNEYVS